MKLLLIILLIASNAVLAKGPKSRINVRPLRTDNNGFYISSDVNIYKNSSTNNSSINYSSYYGWDLGLTAQNLVLTNYDAQGHLGDFYFNASQTFFVNYYIQTTVGTQLGYKALDYHKDKSQQYYYLDNRFELFKDWHIHIGSYYANKSISSTNNLIGYLVGTEVEYDNVSLTIDYFSGYNATSGAQAVLSYQSNNDLRLYTGVNIPEQGGFNEFNGIVGFQWLLGKYK